MLNRSLKIVVLPILLALALAGCAGARMAETATPAPPVTVPSAQPSVPPTATAVLPGATSTMIPPTVTVAAVPPGATPAAPPSDPTPTLLPPSPTSTSSAQPTATPRPSPTSTPQPVPLPNDPATLRVELQVLVGGLAAPVGIANAGDGSGRLFVVEKAGRIRVVRKGALDSSPFLDVAGRVRSSSSEQGLLGLAFHPNYARNGTFFVNYTNVQGDTVVARFSVGSDPERADPTSEGILLTVDQPAANHNGGHLAFGPDGLLYIGLGDGGGANDQFGNGQNVQALPGKMLRLDVDHGPPYAVPKDNPFVGNAAFRTEIWATGLRNPWRYSFDRLTGDLYIADVGQNQYEEVDFQPAASRGGQNYGWSIMEGLHCFPADRACNREGLTLPVVEYDHSQGCSVTGGSVYRGNEFPALNGIYLFGDYCSGKIWGLAPTGDGGWRTAELAQADLRIVAFGEDEAGEPYLLDIQGGALFKILARPR